MQSTPFQTIKEVMTYSEENIKNALQTIQYTLHYGSINVTSNPKRLLHPELIVILGLMRLNRVQELGRLKITSKYHSLIALDEKWLEKLLPVFFDSNKVYTAFDLCKKDYWLYTKMKGRVEQNTMSVYTYFQNPHHPVIKTIETLIITMKNLKYVNHFPSVKELVFYGHQWYNLNMMIALRKNKQFLKTVTSKIKHITLIKAHGVEPILLSNCESIRFVGPESLYTKDFAFDNIKEYMFIRTDITEETVKYLVENSPKLEKITFCREPRLARLPSAIFHRGIQCVVFNCPCSTPDTKYDSKIEVLLSTSEHRSQAAQLILALKDIPSTVMTDNGISSCAPLYDGCHTFIKTLRLCSLILPNELERNQLIHSLDENYVHLERENWIEFEE